MLRFGAGQFYAKRIASGIAFLVIDGFSAAVLIAGIAAADEADDEERAVGVLWDATAGSYAIALGAVGLIASHTAQGIMGPIVTRRHNKELLEQQGKAGFFLAPGEGSLVAGVSWRF